MSQLPDALKERGLELSTDPEAYLERYLGYEMKPNEDPDADWRLDVMVGSTCCVPLINGYLNADNDFMDDLHADGAVAGFFCYPLDTLREEEGSEKIFDFRDKLEEVFTTGDGPEILTLTGGATGLFCGYVDFIAWDIQTALQMAKEFFEDSEIPWASFHTFRREAGTVNLKTPPEEEPDDEDQIPELDETLTGVDYMTAFPFTQRQNHGEADQYYIENTHPAIITKGTFEKVQELLRQKSNRQKIPRQIYPLSRKVYCGQCGTPFARRAGKSGLVVWVCRKHDKGASKCTMGRIPESALYAAFAGMYNKLKQNAGIVLQPALKQLEELRDALQRDDPAMLAVNRAIAQASEQSHRISQLQAAGLLDADACAAKFNEINARLAQLRAERRRLLKNEDIDDAIDALQRTADLIQCGPERLEGFDEGLFHDLVERIVVESQTCVRFRLRGGLELTEQLREVRR